MAEEGFDKQDDEQVEEGREVMPGTAQQETALSYSFDFHLWDDALSLEAHKRWTEGSASVVIDMVDQGTPEAEEGALTRFMNETTRLTQMQQTEGVEAAMNEAERMAVSTGFLDPQRDDPRFFMEGPPDAFTSLRAKEQAQEVTQQPEATYYFDFAPFTPGELALEAVKEWDEGRGLHRSIVRLDVEDEVEDTREVFQQRVDELTGIRETEGLQAAMNAAEQIAVESGMLRAERSDPRLFTEGPPDPFSTLQEQELADHNAEIAVFQDHADRTARSLLEPAAPDVNYAFTIAPGQEPETVELLAEKLWIEPDGEFKTEHQAIREYPRREEGEAFYTRDALYGVGREFGRDAAMQSAIAIAADEGYIPLEQPYLFTAGPDDGYTAPAPKREFAAREAESNRVFLLPEDAPVNYALEVVDADPDTVALEMQKHWETPDGKAGIDVATVKTYDAATPGSFDEALTEQQRLLGINEQEGLGGLVDEIHEMRGDAGKPLFHHGPADDLTVTGAAHIMTDEMPRVDLEALEAPAVQPELHHDQDWGRSSNAAHWNLDTLAVNDPAGDALGYASVIIRYPHVDSNTVASPSDTATEIMEIAHFENLERADDFGEQFLGQLVPGEMDGPDLALAVAQGEGLPGQWQVLEGQALKDYRDSTLTLTHERENWHPYDTSPDSSIREVVENPAVDMEIDF